MKNKLIWISLLVLLVIPLVSATTYYKQGELLDLKVPCFNNGSYCSAASECNITVIYPNSSVFVDNLRMSNNLAYHNYTLPNSTIAGVYTTSIMCNDTGLYDYTVFDFEVTGNGRANPEGIIVVMFSLLFLVILGSAIYLVIYSVGHMLNLDFDVLDLAWNWGAYFVILGTYLLQQQYLGLQIVERFMVIFIWVLGIAMVFAPLVAFVLSLTLGQLKRFEDDEDDY